jgi:hypothetical protein
MRNPAWPAGEEDLRPPDSLEREGRIGVEESMFHQTFAKTQYSLSQFHI